MVRSLVGVLVASIVALASAAASAQTFPSKPIHFLVPFSPGSGTDIVARAVGDTLARSLQQPVVIENKPGAGGTIAAAQVARSDPDGHTILIHSSGHALNPAIYPNLPYDTLRDLTGITPLAAMPNVLVVSPARGWKAVSDLVAEAKAKPGQLNYASAGVGSATHLNAEKFRLQAGIEAVHVPFKGTPEAMSDVVAGRVEWFFAPLSAALPLVREGRLRALAVSTPTRAALLPDVPTTVEAGVAGSDYVFWVAMLVASATPPAVRQRLHDEAVKALADPEVKDRLVKLGAEPFTMEEGAFNAYIRSEVESAGRIAKAANLKSQ